jgi:hypothetical protein
LDNLIRPAGLGVNGNPIFHILPLQRGMRFPLYPSARVPFRRCTQYPVPGYGGGSPHRILNKITARHATLLRSGSLSRTVPLYESKLFINRSCLILVLTTVLGCPRRTDVKKDVKKYQGSTTSQENTILKYHFHHTFFWNLYLIWTKFGAALEPRVTSNARLRFSASSFSYISQNKVPHTKVQYLPSIREAKSHN